jgi:AcrR family transcriptional regulator
LTGGIFYGTTSLYRYFKGKKARAVARLDYEACELNYKKSNRDLFIKLAQEITKESDLSLSYQILKKMIRQEGDKHKKAILNGVAKGFKGFIVGRSLDIGDPVPDRITTVKEITKRNRYPKISFSEINALVNSAKKIGLY